MEGRWAEPFYSRAARQESILVLFDLKERPPQTETFGDNRLVPAGVPASEGHTAEIGDSGIAG